MTRVDAVVIGAGPAGLAAATLLAKQGTSVVLLDEQAAPGGQIYRAIEHTSPALRSVLGKDYVHGEHLVAAFRASGADYRPGSSVWQVTPEREVWFSRDGRSELIEAGVVILATGAMERAVPVPGWTLPGALTAGAAQILLKSAGLVPASLVIAGSGPLVFLLAAQCIAAGVPPRAILDTDPHGTTRKALRHLPAALRGAGLSYILKGINLHAALKANGVARYTHATDLRIEGEGRVEAISFRSGGAAHRLETPVVALHEGVIPSQQMARSIGCEFTWDVGQHCFRPAVNSWGASSIDNVLIAGDGAAIAGARAAEHAGRVAACEALRRLGRIDASRRDALAARDRADLAAHQAVRPFLDTLFPPPEAVLRPADDVVVCRCEEVTAGAVRRTVAQGCLGPNQAKSFLRSGMGPCQGRICGPVVAELIAQARGVKVADVGYFRIRPPLKPITVGELASVDLAPAEAAE